MASILAEPFKNVTSEGLKALNFTENNWGRPDKIFYPTTPSESRDGTLYRECYWNEEKTDFEVFTEDMEITKGKEYMILAKEENGFILNWLGTVYTYDMLEH